MHDLKAFFLVGPTATGKTAVTQWIAEHYSFDILSADAMMVYRDMDIGTAKPDEKFRSKVRYWGLDLVSALAPFNVGMYRASAVAAVREVVSAGRRMIVTGGTGLYVKSLTHGLHRLPARITAVRTEADKLMRQGGIGALQEWTKTQAPARYESLADKTNPRRLVRAIELSSFSPDDHNNTWLQAGKGPQMAGLFMPMDQLYGRIKLRVKAMYQGGLLDEVERLLRMGFETAPTAGKAIGYAEAIHFLRGNFTLEEAMELTVKRTRQLAKRQMTWFRNQANVEWLAIDSGMQADQIARMVMECWEKTGPTAIAG